MSNIHNNGESDKSLKDGLDKLGHAYRQLDQDEPPELLDQAILNIAHRSVEKKSHWTQFGWLHGLTTAAVFVLAFSLILNQRESAPVFENGMGSTKPARLQNEKVARKQSLDVKAGSRREMKLNDDTRQDTYQDTPPTKAPESESVAGQSRSPQMESRLSRNVQDVMKDKAESADQDMEKADVMLEEISLDEMDFGADAPISEKTYRQLSPDAAAVPMDGASEPEARESELSDIQAEQKLLKILELKRSGDPGWKTELASFMESHPDYPLPQELKDP